MVIGSPNETRLVGVVVPGGLTCQLFRVSSGQIIALQSMLQARIGARRETGGQFVEVSTCMQGNHAFMVAKAKLFE